MKQRDGAPAVILSERHCNFDVVSGVRVINTGTDANREPAGVEASDAFTYMMPVEEVAVNT